MLASARGCGWAYRRRLQDTQRRTAPSGSNSAESRGRTLTSTHRTLWILLALVLRVGSGLACEGLTASSDERNRDGMARAFWLSGLVQGWGEGRGSFSEDRG